jgi:hypothetical protein
MTERKMTEGFRERVLMNKFEPKREYPAGDCKMFA